MKKNMVRIVALLLVAMLALTLIPMGALAVDVDVYSDYYQKQNPDVYDFHYDYEEYLDYGNKSGSSVTIKTSDYDSHAVINKELYDLKGIVDFFETDFSDLDNKLIFSSSITITDKNWEDWDSPEVWLSYVPHRHKLSYWYSDSTTHWRECLVCKHYEQFDEDFMFQNWHSDGDEDRICDVCGADIPYHEVRVIETEGGTITVNEEEAPHRRKITADVEPAEGYKLKKLHFTKVRDDGSEQEITRYKKNGQFWTYMPTYELEVSAEFVKTK